MIHPLASVSDDALIGCDTVIGPFCHIEANVVIGAGCRLESHVVVKRGTVLGEENHIGDGAVLGGAPQHLQAPERTGRVVIGRGNTIRENCTIHRALHDSHETVIGDGNLLMVNVHVAHDCRLGNNTILVNNVMLAGHVTVEDRAYLAGAAGVHQFCRIGGLAMVGGQSHVSKDIPPYVTVDGKSSYIVGLNLVGLRRSGFTASQIAELKAAYRLIYRSGLRWNEVVIRLREEFPDGPAARFHEFFSSGRRGFTPERRMPPGSTIKLSEAALDAGKAEAA